MWIAGIIILAQMIVGAAAGVELAMGRRRSKELIKCLGVGVAAIVVGLAIYSLTPRDNHGDHNGLNDVGCCSRFAGGGTPPATVETAPPNRLAAR
jgi:hypothetical protein